MNLLIKIPVKHLCLPILDFLEDDRRANVFFTSTTALSAGGYLYAMMHSSSAISRIALATLTGLHAGGWISHFENRNRRYPGTAGIAPLVVFASEVIMGAGAACTIQVAGEIFRKIMV